MAPPLPTLLQPLPTAGLEFITPVKRIQTAVDLPSFHSSPAYALITTFIGHLNSCISPLDPSTNQLSPATELETNAPCISPSTAVTGIVDLISALSDLTNSAPPDQGPRRFGNIAFRRWLELVNTQLQEPRFLDQFLPASVLEAKTELIHYLLGSFGSGERLDYGTGHELSFAAFLCGIWRLGGFKEGDEKALVVKGFDAYFKLVRRLVITYSLEPAGSHGVWGLDDHVFLPYIFGSSQLTTFKSGGETGLEDADSAAEIAGVPKPAEVYKVDVIKEWRERNLYFGAVGFVMDVKKGPFWEHSPILYDISGVQKGWGKINEGMIKMYLNEVLNKFPVVQHFPFGTIFAWSNNPDDNRAPPPSSEAHETRAPWAGTRPATTATTGVPTTRAPWATGGAPAAAASAMPPTTRAPWASAPPSSDPVTRSPWAPTNPETTRAPWASQSSSGMPPPSGPGGMETTRAPWASANSATPASPPAASLSAIYIKGPSTIPSPGTHHSTSPSTHLPPISPSLSSHTSPSTESLPWERPQAEEEKEESGANLRNVAYVGPARTSSPDSAMAQEGGRSRRGSATGGVRVAETGDLSGRRASRNIEGQQGE